MTDQERRWGAVRSDLEGRIPWETSSGALSARPELVDVLIIGGGPAGMLLAAQLSRFAGITTRIVERRDSPLQVGQADGVVS